MGENPPVNAKCVLLVLLASVAVAAIVGIIVYETVPKGTVEEALPDPTAPPTAPITTPTISPNTPSPPPPPTTTTTTTAASTTTTTIEPTTITTLPPATTTTTPVPTTTADPLTIEEQSRVDCWPESRYSGVVGTEEQCNDRGCAWDSSSRPDVPACYVSPQYSMGYGYSLESSELINETDIGIRTRLVRRSAPDAQNAEGAHEYFIFEAVYYGENILNFKVL